MFSSNTEHCPTNCCILLLLLGAERESQLAVSVNQNAVRGKCGKCGKLSGQFDTAWVDWVERGRNVPYDYFALFTYPEK